MIASELKPPASAATISRSKQPDVAGSPVLRGLKSVVALDKEKNEQTAIKNDPIVIDNAVQLRAALAPGQVREGTF